MAPALATLAQRGAPVVVHALGRAPDAAHRVWEALAPSRLPVLVSASPQEAHDLAALAHALAHSARTPVCHIVDEAALRTVEGARIVHFDALAALQPRRAAAAAAPAAAPLTEAALDAAFASLAPLLGRRHTGVEYIGHPQAQLVVVCIGGAGAALGAAAAAFGRERAAAFRPRLGVLRVSVLSPWPLAAIEAAIPSTATVRLLLLSPMEDGGASTAAALERAGGALQPLLMRGTGPLDRAEAELLLSELEFRLGMPPCAELLHPPPPPLHTLDVWALGGAGDAWAPTGALPSSLLSLLAATEGLQACSRGGDFSATRFEGACTDGFCALTRVTQRLGHSAAAPPLPSKQSVVVISHPALLRHYDALASLPEGTAVLLCLPPPLASEPPPPAPSAPNAESAARAYTLARAQRLIAHYAPASDASRLARMGYFALPVEGLAEAAVPKGCDAGLAKGFLLRSAALCLFMGGQSALPALSPLLLADAQAAARPGQDVRTLLQLLSSLEGGLVQVPPGAGAEDKGPASQAAALAEAPQRARLPTGAMQAQPHAPSTTPAPAAIQWRGLGPHQWIAPDRGAAAQPGEQQRLRRKAARPDPRDALSLALAFPAAFAPRPSARPLESSSADHVTYEATVSKFLRFTPEKYDRNIFHIEMDTTGTGLTYEIGSALGVHPRNDAGRVSEFLAWYGVPWDHVVTLAAGEEEAAGAGGGRVVCTTAHRTLQQDFDIFGRVGKEFYEALAPFAEDGAQSRALAALGAAGGDGADEVGFTARALEAATPADVLREFTSARPPFEALLRILPRIKPRHYSIASSMRAHPTSVHLLVVEVEWRTPRGRTAFGLASHYLAGLRAGDPVTISVLHSEMHLPASPTAPIFMAGLGTGMAPFRAFIQERCALAASGVAVGPMTLYFGARHRAQEYLYGEELEAASAAGLLTLRLAFSRDTAKKVYIQHLMQEDGAALWAQLQGSGAGQGSFYLCGPTWPEADVENAISSAFTTHGSLSPEAAAKRIQEMKSAKRYVLEVY